MINLLLRLLLFFVVSISTFVIAALVGEELSPTLTGLLCFIYVELVFLSKKVGT